MKRLLDVVLWSVLHHTSPTRIPSEFPEFQHFAFIDSSYGLRFNLSYNGRISLEAIDVLNEMSSVVIEYSWYKT